MKKQMYAMYSSIRICIVLLFSYFALKTNVFAVAVGERVSATVNLNVRQTASTTGNFITTKTSGSRGEVLTGPTSNGGFTWWQILWDDGIQGWSVNSLATLTLLPLPSLSVTPSATSATVSWSGSRTNVSLIAYAVRNINTDTLIVNTTTSASNSGVTLTGLIPNSSYRISVTYKAGTGSAYSHNSQSNDFTTLPLPAPTANVSAATSISTTSAILNGSVNPNGTSTTAYFQYSTSSGFSSFNTTSTTSMGSGSSSQPLSANPSGLSPSTTYYFRVVANGSQSVTSSSSSFTTQAAPQTVVTTGTATNITISSATLNATVNPNGFSTNAYFQWGTTTSYGSNTSSLALGSGGNPIGTSASITGLSPGTTYQFRAVAVGSSTVYGQNSTFTTSAAPVPSVSLGAPANITATSARLNGTVNPNGASTNVQFQYGQTTSYGTLTPVIAVGSGTTSVPAFADISGLSPSTTYHYRLLAGNTFGQSAASSNATFTAPAAPNLAPSISNVILNPIAADGSMTLSLTGSDPEGDSMRWYVYLSQDSTTNYSFVNAQPKTSPIYSGGVTTMVFSPTELATLLTHTGSFKALVMLAEFANTAKNDTEYTAAFNFGYPTVTDIQPRSVYTNSQTTFTVIGTNLYPKMGFAVSAFTANVTPEEDESLGSSTSRVFRLTAPSTTGTRLAGVKTSYTSRSPWFESNPVELPGGAINIHVTVAPQPSITGVSPSPVPILAGNPQQEITIQGSNFVDKPFVYVTWAGGNSTLNATQVTFVSSTELKMRISVGNVADNWTVRVTNPGGQASNTYAFSTAPQNNPPTISGLSGVMRTDGRIDFNYTATDSNGIGYVGVYIVDSAGAVIPGISAASEVQYTTDLASGVAKTLQPWTAAQLQGWLTPGQAYKLRMVAQDGLGLGSGWAYSSAFTYTVAGTVVNVTNVALNSIYRTVPAGSTIEIVYTLRSNAPTTVYITAALATSVGQTTGFVGMMPSNLTPCHLQANEDKQFNTQVVVPGGITGNYFIRSQLWNDRNGDGNIDGSSPPPTGDAPVIEAKNWGTAPITVTAPVPPYLIVTSEGFPEISESGSDGFFRIERVADNNGIISTGSAVTAKVRLDTSIPNAATPSTTLANTADFLLSYTDSANTKHIISSTTTDVSVTIPAGVLYVSLRVEPKDDVIAEGSEFIRVLLSNDAAYTVATGAADMRIVESRWEVGALNAPTALWNNKKVGGAFVFPITITTTAATDGYPRKIRRVFLQTPPATGVPPQNFAQAHLDSTSTSANLTAVQWRTAVGTGLPIFKWSDINVTPGQTYLLQFAAEIAPAAGASANDPIIYQLSAPFTVTYQNSFTGTVETPQKAPLFKVSQPVSLTASSTGGSGTVSYQWFGSEVPAGSTGSALTFLLNNFGLSPVITRHADANNNVWWTQTMVSLARTSQLGNAATDPSRRLAIQGVDVASGNLFVAFPVLSVNCPIGVDFNLVSYYNSGVTIDASDTWSWNYTHAALTIDGFLSQGQNGRTITVDLGDRTRQEFVLDTDGTYTPHTPGNFSKLVEYPDTGTFKLLEKNGLIYEFGFTNDAKTPTTHYYEKRQLLTIKNHLGHGLSFFYQAVPGSTTGERRLSHILDATARRYDFFYDTSNRLQAVKDFTDWTYRNVVYFYDTTSLRPDRFRDVLGKTTQFIYHATGTSAAGRLRHIIQPEGNTPIAEITYYSGTRRTAAIRDGMGNSTSFNYLTNATNVIMPDSDENLRIEFDPTSTAISKLIESYGSAAQHELTTKFKDVTSYRQANAAGLSDSTTQTVPDILDKNGNPAPSQTTSAEYNSYGTPIKITDAEQGFSTASPVVNPDANFSLPQTVTDRRGKSWIYNWNTTTGQLNGMTSPTGDPVSYIYWPNGLPKTITDGETNLTQFFYTTHGYPDRIIDAAGHTTTFETDLLGRVTRIISPVTDTLNRSSSYTYNNAGQPLTVTLDDMSIAAGESKTLTMAYDDNGRLEFRTDRRLAVTEFRYNAVNLTREVILPASAAAPGRRNIILGYDKMNRPSTLENLNGHTTTRTYDTRGRLSTIINGLGQTILTRGYYANNLIAYDRDGEGIITFYQWDRNKRLVRRTNMGTSATDTSDDVAVEYPEYDSEGNLLTVRDPRGILTLHAYDDSGRRIQSTTVKQGQSTSRLTALADPANFHQVFSYDRNSQMKTFKDPEGHTTTFFYDVLKRLDHYTDAANRTWNYTYYHNSLPKTVKTPDNRTTTYIFDGANRIDRIDYPDAVFADFGLDANGNQLTLQDQHGTTTSAFDSRNQITSTTDTFGQTVRYDYFPGGNLKNLTYPGNHVVAYTWDAAERMKTVTPWVGGTWTYNYRTNSQIDNVTNNNGSITDYSYDTLGRLNDLWNKTSGGSLIARQQFTQFDKAGNPEVENYTPAPGFPPIPAPPVITSATYDPANRLQTVNGSAATVDGGGRTLATPAPTAGTFTWEGPDWLKTFTRGTTTQSYKVSGTGDRIERSLIGPSPQTTRYTLDRSGSMANVLAETDAANSPRRYYIHGLGLLASIDASNGSVSTYHFDHRGNTLALTNATQAVTDAYAYSVFGTHIATGSTANPFRFAGQVGIQTDSPELLHMRARYYQPTLSRFISQDPSGFADGMNVFAYVGGEVFNHFDPLGRESESTYGLHEIGWTLSGAAFSKFATGAVTSAGSVGLTFAVQGALSKPSLYFISAVQYGGSILGLVGVNTIASTMESMGGSAKWLGLNEGRRFKLDSWESSVQDTEQMFSKVKRVTDVGLLAKSVHDVVRLPIQAMGQTLAIGRTANNLTRSLKITGTYADRVFRAQQIQLGAQFAYLGYTISDAGNLVLDDSNKSALQDLIEWRRELGGDSNKAQNQPSLMGGEVRINNR